MVNIFADMCHNSDFIIIITILNTGYSNHFKVKLINIENGFLESQKRVSRINLETSRILLKVGCRVGRGLGVEVWCGCMVGSGSMIIYRKCYEPVFEISIRDPHFWDLRLTFRPLFNTLEIKCFYSYLFSGIACVKTPDQRTLLAEVMICFSKDLTIIDCKAGSFGGCSEDEAVNFHPEMTSRMIKQLTKAVLFNLFVFEAPFLTFLTIWWHP